MVKGEIMERGNKKSPMKHHGTFRTKLAKT